MRIKKGESEIAQNTGQTSVPVQTTAESNVSLRTEADWHGTSLSAEGKGIMGQPQRNAWDCLLYYKKWR